MLERRELLGEQDPETGRWRIRRVHVEDLRNRREQEKRKKPTAPVQQAPAPELVTADKTKFR